MSEQTAERRLLSTDLDGTIIFDGRVRRADAEAMRRWRRAGHLLVMNTGRSITALASALEGSGVDYDYAILYTGAVLADPAGRVLRARTLPEGLVDEVLEVVSAEESIKVFCTTLDGDLLLHDTIGSSTELLTLFTPGTTADLAGRAVVGIPLQVRDAAVAGRMEALVARRWGDHLEAVLNQHRDDFFLDLVPAGSSKGAGLTGLVETVTAPGGAYEGQSLVTYAVGDSWNDMSMHAVADVGVAMEQAPDGVAAACQRTTPSVAALIDQVLSSRH